jgi:hypothetical protein
MERRIMREFSSVDRIFGYFDASQRDINDKRLPDHVLPDGNCCLASHTGVNWSLCRSGILYETQGLGVVLVVLFMLVAIAAWQFERYM